MLQDTDREVATFLNRKFGGLIASIETVAKEDLDLVRFTFRVFRFYPWRLAPCNICRVPHIIQNPLSVL